MDILMTAIITATLTRAATMGTHTPATRLTATMRVSRNVHNAIVAHSITQTCLAWTRDPCVKCNPIRTTQLSSYDVGTYCLLRRSGSVMPSVSASTYVVVSARNVRAGPITNGRGSATDQANSDPENVGATAWRAVRQSFMNEISHTCAQSGGGGHGQAGEAKSECQSVDGLPTSYPFTAPLQACDKRQSRLK